MDKENVEFANMGVELAPLDNVNLFEMFNKQKAADPDKEVTFENEEDDTDTGGGQQGQKGKEKAATEGGGTEFDTSKILDMAKNKALGKEDEDDDDETDTGGKDKTESGKSKVDNRTATQKTSDQEIEALYSHLLEAHGFEELEDGADFKGTIDEKLDALIERNLEDKVIGRAEGMILEAFHNNPSAELAKDLLHFLQKGGHPADFVATRKYDDLTPEYISGEKEEDKQIEKAKKVMTSYYETLSWDPARIAKTVGNLEKSGQLLEMAEDTLPEFIKLNKQRKAITDDNINKQKARSEAEIKEYNNNLVGLIEKADEIGPFKLMNAKERQKVKEFCFKPIRLEDGTTTTAYLQELKKHRSSPQYTLFQALTFMNKGIKLDDIKAAAAEETKKGIRAKLEKAVEGNKIEKSTTASQGAQSGGSNKNSSTNNLSFLDFNNLETVIQ